MFEYFDSIFCCCGALVQFQRNYLFGIQSCIWDTVFWVVESFNRSLSSGVVPEVFRVAYITPLLKKSDMDPMEPRSYRPISNMSVVSKHMERLVARQLLSHLQASGMLPRLQSTYRDRPKFHLARLNSTRLDTFDFVERVETSGSSRAVPTWLTIDELAIVLACTSLVVFMLLHTQILFVSSNKII